MRTYVAIENRRLKDARRTRARLRTAALLACAVAAGCGGGGGGGGVEEEPPPVPTLEPVVADELATASERVADLLAAGDTCGAAHAADDLHEAVLDAINRGEVPPELQEDLTATSNELVDTVNCPPPPETETDGDEGDGDGDGDDD